MDISKLNSLITPSGTMAISNKAKELKEEGKPVIGFGAGEPDFSTPSYVIEDVKKAAEDPKNHKYTAVAGLEILRNEISRTTSIYSNFDSDPNNIVITNGGKQAIFNSLIAILDPGDEVLIPTFCDPTYKRGFCSASETRRRWLEFSLAWIDNEAEGVDVPIPNLVFV